MARVRPRLAWLLGACVTTAASCTSDFGPLFAGCPATLADCNGVAGDGCEIDLTNNAAHCGQCGVACSGACVAGQCTGEGGGGVGGTGGAGVGGSGGALPPGQVIWSARIGDTGTQRARSVATDAQSNVVLAGYFFQEIVLEGTSYPAAGEHDVFVQKRDKDGHELWSRRFGGSGNDTCRDVAVEPGGDLVLTGHFGDTIDFGGGPLVSAGLQDLFLAKFAADGTHLWSKAFGDATEPQFGHSVALGADGSVHLGGEFSGVVDLGDGDLGSAGGSDILIARFDAGGTLDWAHAYGGLGTDYARSVAVDGDGNVYVAGHYTDDVEVGGAVLAGDGDLNLFVAKYSASGVHLWSHGWGLGAVFTEAAVELHPAGGVVVSGEFSGSVDLGSESLTSAGGSFDVYVLHLDAGGAVVSSARFGDAQEDLAEALAVSAAGDEIVAGQFAGVIEFGGPPMQTIAAEDVFLAKLDGDLGHVWSRSYGGPDNQHAHSLAVDPEGFVLMTGCLYGDPSSIDFGDGALNGAGEFDVWLVKLAP